MPKAQSPAARLLNDYGVRIVDVAIVAGTSTANVSRWLAGTHHPRHDPEALPTALQRFLGPERAGEVLDAIEVARG